MLYFTNVTELRSLSFSCTFNLRNISVLLVCGAILQLQTSSFLVFNAFYFCICFFPPSPIEGYSSFEEIQQGPGPILVITHFCMISVLYNMLYVILFRAFFISFGHFLSSSMENVAFFFWDCITWQKKLLCNIWRHCRTEISRLVEIAKSVGCIALFFFMTVGPHIHKFFYTLQCIEAYKPVEQEAIYCPQNLLFCQAW